MFQLLSHCTRFKPIVAIIIINLWFVELVMKIWVDADACPVAIKEILFRAADRTQTMLTLIANQYLRTPPSKFIHFKQVQQGFDVADDHIVELAEANDLVITSDIPLADEVISKGALALSPRGELYTKENIKSGSGIEIVNQSGVTEIVRKSLSRLHISSIAWSIQLSDDL